MAITALPTPPSRSDPANFIPRADAFHGALPTFATEANALQADVNAKQLAAEASATAAAASAGTADSSSSAANSSALSSAASAASSAASETSIKSKVLTAKAGDPSVDDNGNTLLAGVTYFNTTLLRVRIYNGSAWQDAVGAISGNFTVIREYQTAGVQTIFNLTNTYVTGTNTLMVYLNGVRLMPADYTETSTSVVTLLAPTVSGDVLLFEIAAVSAGTTAVAGLTSFNPAGGLTSTNVQAAITELASRPTFPDYLILAQGVI